MDPAYQFQGIGGAIRTDIFICFLDFSRPCVIAAVMYSQDLFPPVLLAAALPVLQTKETVIFLKIMNGTEEKDKNN